MPVYKVISPDGAMLMSGVLNPFGAVLRHDGWPTRDLEPVGPDASRIYSFWKKHSSVGEICGRFSSPWSRLVDGYYLPAVANISSAEINPQSIFPSGRIPDVPKPAEMHDGMPAYTLRGRAWYNKEILDAGAEVVFLGWPKASLLEPANAAAHAVVAYQDEYASNPKFGDIRSPWCEFARAVVLPALPRSTRLPNPRVRGAFSDAGGDTSSPYYDPRSTGRANNVVTDLGPKVA